MAAPEVFKQRDELYILFFSEMILSHSIQIPFSWPQKLALYVKLLLQSHDTSQKGHYKGFQTNKERSKR